MNPANAAAIDAATRSAVDAFLDRVAARFPVHEAILFGSRARGSAHTDSDADVLLLLRGARGPFMQTKLEMADMAFDTLLDANLHIQPLPVWDEEWNHPDSWSNPELLRNVKRTGICVWRASLT